MVSEALYAEAILVLKNGNWSLIQTPDGYQGWVDSSTLFDRPSYLGTLQTTRLAAHLYAFPDTEYGPLLTLPYGTQLTKISDLDERWVKVELIDGQFGYIQRGDLEEEPCELLIFSKKFLNLPYTWGGRSSFGFDCSGFVQFLYKKIGIFLPRDSKEQACFGKKIDLLDLQAGDLIFWGKGEVDICHVGMSIGEGKFIHTSSRENLPYLRISDLSDPAWRGDAHYPFVKAITLAGDLNRVLGRQKADLAL